MSRKRREQRARLSPDAKEALARLDEPDLRLPFASIAGLGFPLASLSLKEIQDAMEETGQAFKGIKADFLDFYSSTTIRVEPPPRPAGRRRRRGR